MVRKRTPKNGDGVCAPVADEKQVAAGSSRGAHEVAPVSFNAEKSCVFGASPSMPRSSSSKPCRHFQRGFCWYGDECRFQHSEGPSTTPSIPSPIARPQHPPRPASNPSIPPPRESKPFNPPLKSSAPFNATPKAPFRKERAPEECLDWYLSGSCPRFRTCRYAHSMNAPLSSMKEEKEFGNRKTSGKSYDDYSFLANFGLGGGIFDDDEMGHVMGNGGFTDDDIYELSLQGIKPWDPEAGAALAVLKGWDMDGYGDYDYY